MVSLSNNGNNNIRVRTTSNNVNVNSNTDSDINANMNGNAQRAKSWAVGTGLIDGQDYSAKYYANQARQIEENIASDTNEAHIWAEGTDEEVEALGGTHSSKGWVNYVLTNPPTASVTETETGATITITDINGTTTASITNGTDGIDGTDGTDGVDGFSPSASVTTTLTGATISITDKNGTTTADITNGIDGTNGTNGTDGQDGFSPTATITESSGVYTISITDKNGTTSESIDLSKYLLNKANGTGSISVLGTATNGNYAVNIGSSSYAAGYTVSIGNSASANGGYSVVLGNSANSYGTSGVSIGRGAAITSAGTNGVAIGRDAKVQAAYSIQLGKGTNTTASSMFVGFDNNGSAVNYQMLDGTTGLIPDARISSNIARTTDIGNGTITLTQGGTTKGTFTVNQSGNTTIDLDAGGGSGTVTDVQVNGTSVVTSGVASVTVPTDTGDLTNNAGFIKSSSLSGYLQNTATGSNALTISGTATAKTQGINIGGGSQVTGNYGVALGCYAYGNGSQAMGLGNYARATANYAIQIGKGTNSTASSLQIGFDGTTYQLLDGTTGLIPDARLSSNIARTSDIPAGVFVAEYGTTTYQDVLTAYNANKKIYVKVVKTYSTEYAELETAVSVVPYVIDQFIFSNIHDLYILSSNSTWSTNINTRRNIGEIVQSTIPLTDAGLHLLDGSLLAYGSYQAFIDYIADLYDSGNYNDIFETEANWQSSVTTYGVCGKFVYDNVNQTVRLPKITGFTEGTIDPTVLGDLVQAGLPNINAVFVNHWRDSYSGKSLTPVSGAISVDSNSYPKTNYPNVTPSTTGNYNYDQTLKIDASLSSSIYGNSNTVQPQSIKVLYYIVIATTTKTAIQVDIDQITTDLNGKADVDLTNVNDSGTSRGASWSMPSDTYEDLTLGASGTTYTAPANGWFYIEKSSGGTDKFVQLRNSTKSYAANLYLPYSNAVGTAVLPVCKNDTVTVSYDATSTTYYFRFIYAKGSESEAS